MASMNEEGQWIILMAFFVCIGLFFLGMIVNESTIVGRTTSESVLDFSKSDIQDLKDQVFEWNNRGDQAEFDNFAMDVNQIAMSRQNAIIRITDNGTRVLYNNGVTEYNATFYF